MNNIFGDSNSTGQQTTDRRMTRFAATVLAIFLPAMGFVGCVHGPQPGSHQAAYVGLTNGNGRFLTPTHAAVQAFVAGVNSTVSIQTAWSTATGVSLSEETVSCFLKKVGSSDPYQYCHKVTVTSPPGNTDLITFTFNVSTTGTYYIYTYSTGTLSDNSNMDPLPDGATGHCPHSLHGHHHHDHHHG